MSACSAGLECRNDRPDSAPWRLASPLRTHGSVMLCLRTHFWRTTGWDKRAASSLRVADPRALVAAEEEESVFDDRAAERSAELIPFQLVAAGGKETSRVEFR